MAVPSATLSFISSLGVDIMGLCIGNFSNDILPTSVKESIGADLWKNIVYMQALT